MLAGPANEMGHRNIENGGQYTALQHPSGVVQVLPGLEFDDAGSSGYETSRPRKLVERTVGRKKRDPRWCLVLAIGLCHHFSEERDRFGELGRGHRRRTVDEVA